MPPGRAELRVSGTVPSRLGPAVLATSVEGDRHGHHQDEEYADHDRRPQPAAALLAGVDVVLGLVRVACEGPELGSGSRCPACPRPHRSRRRPAGSPRCRGCAAWTTVSGLSTAGAAPAGTRRSVVANSGRSGMSGNGEGGASSSAGGARGCQSLGVLDGLTVELRVVPVVSPASSSSGAAACWVAFGSVSWRRRPVEWLQGPTAGQRLLGRLGVERGAERVLGRVGVRLQDRLELGLGVHPGSRERCGECGVADVVGQCGRDLVRGLDRHRVLRGLLVQHPLADGVQRPGNARAYLSRTQRSARLTRRLGYGGPGDAGPAAGECGVQDAGEVDHVGLAVVELAVQRVLGLGDLEGGVARRTRSA